MTRLVTRLVTRLWSRATDYPRCSVVALDRAGRVGRRPAVRVPCSPWSCSTACRPCPAVEVLPAVLVVPVVVRVPACRRGPAVPVVLDPPTRVLVPVVLDPCRSNSTVENVPVSVV